MKEDPTIQRIREARHQVSESSHHDPRKIVDYYIELQKKYTQRLVPEKPFHRPNSWRGTDVSGRD